MYTYYEVTKEEKFAVRLNFFKCIMYYKYVRRKQWYYN